jgi:formylglycine-generating enzyme required for sulfatase activity
LRAWQYADYFEGQRERAFQRLLVSLKRRADSLGLMAEENIPTPKTSKPEVKRPEEKIVSAPIAEELKEEPKKEILAKPFTKLLDPSSLSPKKTSSPYGGKQSVRKSKPNNNLRWLGIGGIVFIGLLFALFSGNYFVQNLFTTSNNSPTSQLTNTPPTNPVAGDPWMQIIDGMTLVFVPAGKFTMGSGENLDQQPIHQVDMDAFWIDQTEVTNNMYAKCVDAGKCDLPNFPLHYYDSSYANHPVVFVSWNDAFAYCFWAHRRLPTEAEWEKAARGTESFFYPWGNESPNSTLLNYNRNVGSTTEVGKYPDGVSVYGALDMAGNVWEWVSSLHKPYPYDASDGRENMDSLEDRVHRGGSWNLSGVSSTYRSSGSPTFSVNVIGFRCAQSP